MKITAHHLHHSFIYILRMPRALGPLPARDVITTAYAGLAALSLLVPAVHAVVFELLWNSGMLLMGVALTCLVGTLLWSILRDRPDLPFDERLMDAPGGRLGETHTAPTVQPEIRPAHEVLPHPVAA
jgi:hypothetical protein